ncbi:unnamed protein product [Heterosigma akashiwo]|mmetsp:Transcript_10029/g.14042  ORF Transcript_10029/g.14042 Transcript_10029/m.14042 type:complete len:255 (+) Transcript_10029:88-852(+)
MGCCNGKEKKGQTAEVSESTSLLEAFSRPEWTSDKEAHSCFECHQAFDVVERRHHCRRCQNIFCGNCSRFQRPVLIFKMTNSVRLCEKCYDEVPSENEFISKHLPLLQEGETFSMGQLVGSRAVFLKISSDLTRLEYRNPGKIGNREAILLHDISSVDTDGMAFRIKTSKGKTLSFVCSTEKEQANWAVAVGEASRRVRAPALKDRVEQDRRKQRDRRRLFELTATKEKRKKERTANRQRISEKYGRRATAAGH